MAPITTSARASRIVIDPQLNAGAGEKSPFVGVCLLLLSALLLYISVRILFADDGDAGFSRWIVAPLSAIPMLVLLMIRYVSLRLYLRN